MALSLAILMLFLALGSGTAVWAAEATGSSTLEQHLEKGYVTQQDLRSAPHNVETEDAAIPAKYFEFVCVNHHGPDGSACTDLQTASISSIKKAVDCEQRCAADLEESLRCETHLQPCSYRKYCRLLRGNAYDP